MRGHAVLSNVFMKLEDCTTTPKRTCSGIRPKRYCTETLGMLFVSDKVFNLQKGTIKYTNTWNYMYLKTSIKLNSGSLVVFVGFTIISCDLKSESFS